VSASVTVTAYCLWAFEEAARVGDVVWFRASIIPFVLVMLRYAFIVEAGGGGAPEDVVFEDRVLQILGLCWVITFALGVIS
jgi:decaprenyl-phosphate phosphoribosyltransferase